MTKPIMYDVNSRALAWGGNAPGRHFWWKERI